MAKISEFRAAMAIDDRAETKTPATASVLEMRLLLLADVAAGLLPAVRVARG
jgi:hypothetical protein